MRIVRGHATALHRALTPNECTPQRQHECILAPLRFHQGPLDLRCPGQGISSRLSTATHRFGPSSSRRGAKEAEEWECLSLSPSHHELSTTAMSPRRLRWEEGEVEGREGEEREGQLPIDRTSWGPAEESHREGGS